MEHISKPVGRVLDRLLCQDQRMLTMYAGENPIRSPERGFYYASPEEASRDRDIDHNALLDAVMKLRGSIACMEVRAGTTKCDRTKALLREASSSMRDSLADIEIALARKAEAELWLEKIT